MNNLKMKKGEKVCQKSLHKDIIECRKCEISRRIINKVIDRGQGKPDLIIIGEAPGMDEDKEGMPFVGRSGKELDKWLVSAGVKNFVIINTIKCRPPRNRDPTFEERTNCKEFMLKQIKYFRDTYKCKKILTVGKVPFEVILPEHYDGKMLPHIGMEHEGWINKQFFDVLIFPHPAYVLRSHKKPPISKLKDFVNRK